MWYMTCFSWCQYKRMTKKPKPQYEYTNERKTLCSYPDQMGTSIWIPILPALLPNVKKSAPK